MDNLGIGNFGLKGRINLKIGKWGMVNLEMNNLEIEDFGLEGRINLQIGKWIIWKFKVGIEVPILGYKR